MPKNIRYIKSVKYMRTPLFSPLIKGSSIVMGYMVVVAAKAAVSLEDLL